MLRIPLKTWKRSISTGVSSVFKHFVELWSRRLHHRRKTVESNEPIGARFRSSSGSLLEIRSLLSVILPPQRLTWNKDWMQPAPTTESLFFFCSLTSYTDANCCCMFESVMLSALVMCPQLQPACTLSCHAVFARVRWVRARACVRVFSLKPTSL